MIILKPLPLIILLVLYLRESFKVDIWVLIFFVVSVIGNLITINKELFSIGLIFHGLAHLILVKTVWKYLKLKARKALYKYFVVFFILFTIIYIFVLEDAEASYLAFIFYGISICFAAAICFTNYLFEMNEQNYFTFLGMMFRVASDFIFAIVLFSISNALFDSLIFITYYLANFFYYRGFLAKSREELEA